MQDGSLAPWRARRVAEHTLTLSAEAAGFVDQMVAPFAHRTGVAQVERLVADAIARFMPAHAQEQAERSAEQRYFTIDHEQVSFAGTSRIHGELDLVDALDLEDAVRRGADQLKALGNDGSLDVRRAAAVGMIARGQQALEFDTTTAPEPRSGSRREVVLVVHLSQDAVLRPGTTDLPAWVENGTGRLVTAGQVAEWCGRPDTMKVTVKNVIDLNQQVTSTGYAPSDRLAEQIRLRDRTCVFPHCQRPARACDLDHIEPFDQGGATSSENLACLCRLHHRMKTHAGWDYAMTAPGVFLWRSPRGHTWRRDTTGTTDLTPPTVPPPDAMAPGRTPAQPPGHPPDQ